jgi:hypothetical protein
MLKRPWVFGAILVMQTLCAVFFVSDIVLTVIGAPYAPIPWAYREVMELAAGAGLILGVVLGALLLRASLRRTREAENALRAASGAFMELVEEHFDDWGLTARNATWRFSRSRACRSPRSRSFGRRRKAP